MNKMTAHSGTQARTVCTKCWRFTEKEAASTTRGTREAFIRKMASALTWKAEWEPAKLI